MAGSWRDRQELRAAYERAAERVHAEHALARPLTPTAGLLGAETVIPILRADAVAAAPEGLDRIGTTDAHR